eukprot:TRINITY_DN8299_c0_g2_i1.p1 TRINITY_DN8299_c0_g2~~TRINITY_DN8299_c0_g2_i1.p1  ORF type:complete len:521 (-),score=125.65 TRINITY_DN8299_c0_g2_i1:118-1680(-)
MDLKEAKGRATGLLKTAKTRAANVRNHSKEYGASVFDRLKDKAQKIDNYIGTAAARATSNTRGRDGGAGNRPSQMGGSSVPSRWVGRPEGRRLDDAVDRLCALGFSVVAVRHALQVCSGRVEDAAAWLVDDVNAEQIIKAEVAAREVEPLRVGESMRIHGLRGAMHLNGVQVTLRKWDKESERWVVQLPDGSAKAIRPKNLEHLGVLGRQGERASLQRQLSELIGDRNPGAAQCLDALTEEELLEAIASLTLDQGDKGAAKPEAQAKAQAEAAKQQSLAAEYAELERQLRESAERIAIQESKQQLRAEELEAAKRLADEREVRLLEAEEEQLRFGDALAQEHERLELERKKVFMLQRSLIENASCAAAGGGASGAGGGGADGRFEMALDDSDAEGAADAVAANGVAAEEEEDDTECGGDAVEQDRDEHEAAEVWDLDWSTLDGAVGEASTVEVVRAPTRRPEPVQAEAKSPEVVETVLDANDADTGEVPSVGFAPPSRQSAAAMAPERSTAPTELVADAG